MVGPSSEQSEARSVMTQATGAELHPGDLTSAADRQDRRGRDVAVAAVFYASEQADFITGTSLLVDSRMTAGYR